MKTIEVPLKRFVFEPSKSFQQTIDAMYVGIGRATPEVMSAMQREQDY